MAKQNESLKVQIENHKAQQLAEDYHWACQAGSEEMQDRTLRAYERYIAKIGRDPLA